MYAEQMLNSTFLHAQSIGEKTERAIWRDGFRTWEKLLACSDDCRLTDRQKALLIPTVEESVERLGARDYAYFAEKIPHREHWRAYHEFGAAVAYVDIETAGSGMDDAITVIGLYDGEKVHSYVKGFNLEEFEDEILKYSTIVTFSGATFDLPHIKRAFPGLHLDQIHIDLCPTLRRLGLTGGLKNIEQSLGLQRPGEIAGMSGWDAVRLWHQYEWGSHEALDLLIEYNAYDVINLKVLAQKAYSELRDLAFGFQTKLD